MFSAFTVNTLDYIFKEITPCKAAQSSSLEEAKALLGIQIAHNPSILLLPPTPVTNDLEQAVNEKHKVNAI